MQAGGAPPRGAEIPQTDGHAPDAERSDQLTRSRIGCGPLPEFVRLLVGEMPLGTLLHVELLHERHAFPLALADGGLLELSDAWPPWGIRLLADIIDVNLVSTSAARRDRARWLTRLPAVFPPAPILDEGLALRAKLSDRVT